MNENLDELIREHAGNETITWIAAQAGVSDGHARARARELGIDTRVPAYAPANKATYSVRPPVAEKEQFARMVNDLMQGLGLTTQNEAITYAVEQAHALLEVGILR